MSAMLQDLVRSGHVVDLILLVVVLEALLIGGLWQRRGRGVAPSRLLPNLLAGVALLLALRAALTGAPWPWIAGALAAAGVAHLVDLAGRWSRRPR
jgi:hypothetical protein